MVDCPCGFGKQLPEEQRTCPACGADLGPLHEVKRLPRMLCESGVRYVEEGRLSEAALSLGASAVLDPNAMAPLKELALLHLRRGQHEDALFCIRRILEVEPNNKDVAELMQEIARQQEDNGMHLSLLSGTTSGPRMRYFVLPILAFATGLMLLPIWHALQGGGERDASQVEREVKDRISRNDAFQHSSVDVTVTPTLINISGSVPTVLHRSLIKEIVEGCVAGQQISLEALKVERPIPAAEQRPGFLYRVKKGETLASLAQLFYGDAAHWQGIFEANMDSVRLPGRIRQGQILEIPLPE
jgi:hypothetical protein